MLVPFFGPKQSFSDNATDRSLYLPCIKHTKKENGAAYGCRAGTIILTKANPNFKVALLQYFTCYAKNHYLYQYLFSKAEWKTNLNQVNLCLRHCSLRLRNVFNFLTLLTV